MDRIILIGFMGTGKTTIGQLLAEKTSLAYVDLDQRLEAEFGMSIQEYFARYGEVAFREQECQLFKQLISDGIILATGGGIVLEETNRLLLKEQPTVVYLDAQPETIYRRIQQDSENVRPLAVEKTLEELKKMYTLREPFYKTCATVQIQTDTLTTEEIAELILMDKQVKR